MNSDGALDSAFVDGGVRPITMQPNKKFVACTVFTMICAGVAASRDLRWQCPIRKAQETRS